MKYFCTDGIRGVVNKKFKPSFLKKLSRSLALYLKRHKICQILVASDTRESSDYLFVAISAEMLKAGIDIDYIQLCSTPCLAFLTKKFDYKLGIMITASHNPFYYNGFKFFNNYGEKCDNLFETEIENGFEHKSKIKSSKYGKVENVSKLKQHYIHHLNQILKSDTSCIFDCAMGATSSFVKQIFKKYDKLSCHPNGQNVNDNCGCLYPERLQFECKKRGLPGFAFDGDGDRILVVSESGKIVDGDYILLILSKFFLKQNDTVVGNIYTNSELEKVLKLKGINLVRVDVGDKFICQKMKELGVSLGGENCGHIILKPFSATGDGLLIAIILLNILSLSKLKIDDIINGYNPCYQANFSVDLNKQFNCKQIYNKAENLKNTGSRIVIRPSGTENVLRVMVENKSKEKAEKILKFLTSDS